MSETDTSETVDKDNAKRGSVMISIFRCIQGEKDTCVDNRCIEAGILQVMLTQCNTGRRETRVETTESRGRDKSHGEG